MTSAQTPEPKLSIRPVQYRDLDAIAQLAEQVDNDTLLPASPDLAQQTQHLRRWYGLHKFLSWFPNPFQHEFTVQVAEQERQMRGLIQVSPFNRTRSTWRVERVMVPQDGRGTLADVGSALLRHCFETIWEARTWLLEVNINNKSSLALYRQNGFQPLAQLTYWSIAAEKLAQLHTHEPDLPNLLPVSNADAQLLYQLDTVSMPPLVRQVYDRHPSDFQVPLLNSLFKGIQNWWIRRDVVRGYVFESQRQVAIGYFQLELWQDGSQPHRAQLNVHPAYTWLYPELMSQMAKIAQDYPPQDLHLTSADYQPEREEYLEQLGATRLNNTLLMSRSVWHKLRETRSIGLEALQLAEMLQGLQPAHKPVPGRMSWTPQAPHSASDSKSPLKSQSQPPSPPNPPSSYTEPENGEDLGSRS